MSWRGAAQFIACALAVSVGLFLLFSLLAAPSTEPPVSIGRELTP